MKKKLLVGAFLLCMNSPVFAQVPLPDPDPSAATVKPAKSAAAAVPAPTIGELLNLALAEYKQQHYGKAADAFEQSSAELRKMKLNTIKDFLPAAPPGWAIRDLKGATEAVSITSQGYTAYRNFQSGTEVVELAITTDKKNYK